MLASVADARQHWTNLGPMYPAYWDLSLCVNGVPRENDQMLDQRRTRWFSSDMSIDFVGRGSETQLHGTENFKWRAVQVNVSGIMLWLGLDAQIFEISNYFGRNKK